MIIKHKQFKTMATTNISMFLLPIVLLLIWVSPAALSCSPHEKKALLQIKQELGNPSMLSSWNASTDCCSWGTVQVECSNTKPYHVSQLELYGLDLPGPVNIPPSIFNLLDLEQLSLFEMPNLTGPIPSQITNLKKLQILYIFSTSVSGPIPDSLAQIKTLWSINLYGNNLSGTLPPSLPSLPTIHVIFLDNNRISGPIPDSYGSFASKNLVTLAMSHNLLSGKIPASLKGLDVYFLDLSWNRLEGDGSVLFGAEKSTEDIRLAGNLFSFDIGKVEFGRNISRLNLKHNRIYGKLPEGLTKLQHLTRLNVSYNQLCGPIPQGGRLQGYFPIDASSFASNKCLCGPPLPPCK
ncbi:polygalacturonase inhibitor 2-like [Arachis stenosperma]|uniref:polygalacturonase inhibitor 2-like n=1 Tax=Arachis stenosperma TaxID=217475 RepID=UPI0025AB9D68|nr:polygalacturonase inhibitor 2-like [Arachis stenosperma]